MEFKNHNKTKESGFSVPDGYFEQLPDKIQQKIRDQRPKERNWVPTYGIIGIAAALLISFGIWWMSDFQNNTSTAYEPLTANAIMESGELDPYGLYEDEIAMASVAKNEPVFSDELSEEAITNYLLEADLDEYDIYNYLKNN